MVEGDTVVMQWSTSGVHTGEIFGISPTGLEVKTSGCSIFRLEGSRIAEAYVYEDWLGFFQQLGVVPCFTMG
jgi:predicted ester cyclase